MLSGYKEKCQFFETKPENIPPKLIGAIQAAEELKEEKLLGLLKPDLGSLSAFSYECYKAAELAANTIEAEEAREALDAANGSSPKPEKFGAGVTVPEPSPFDNWEK